MKTAEVEVLIGAGREIAESLIESAVTAAKDAKQMSNQIFVLRRAAISILAHEAYNQATALGISYAEYVAELTKDIRNESTMLAECGDMELLETGGQ